MSDERWCDSCDRYTLQRTVLNYILQSQLYNVDPTRENPSARDEEAWSDVVGRSQMIKMLILDTNKGALDKMMESTYPDQGGRHPDFGEEILEIARSL